MPAREPAAGTTTVTHRPEQEPEAEVRGVLAGGSELRSEAPRRRWGLGVAAALTALAVLIAANALRPDQPPARPKTGLTGTLVYGVDQGGGRMRLWRWDLAANVAHEGPLISTPQSITAVNAPLGWLGITSAAAGGGQDASILRFLGPRDQPVPLIHGEKVAWGTDGRSLVAASFDHSAGPCPVLIVTVITLDPQQSGRQGHRRSCGSVLSLGRDSTNTYVTLATGDTRVVSIVGRHGIVPVLTSYAMVSLSDAGDLVVTRPSTSGTEGTASLAYSGGQGPQPYRVGGRRMKVSSVLAWPPNTSSALALGSLGQRSGLFLLPAGATTDVSRPVAYLGPATGPTWATYTGDDVGIVLTGGRLFTVVNGVLVPLAPPPGGPVPSGPIAWMG